MREEQPSGPSSITTERGKKHIKYMQTGGIVNKYRPRSSKSIISVGIDQLQLNTIIASTSQHRVEEKRGRVREKNKDV